MSEGERLYHIGGGQYIRHLDNGTYDADGNLTGCFTMAFPPPGEEWPPSATEATAADWERQWNEAMAADATGGGNA